MILLNILRVPPLRVICSCLFVISMLVSACNSEFRKVQKSGDWKLMYDAAMKYYQEEDYYRANLLFEEILPVIKGRPEAEQVQFYYAYSYYYQQKHILSAHYFQAFYETYSRSEYAEEAMFMNAYSLYQESPVPNLDQQSTREAIDAMQRFMNRYPYSEHIDRAQQIIDELQLKLETKAFDNAKLYYELENYKAALVAFENFQNDYPDSDLNEENSFLMVKAQYELARQSIRSLQRERFYATIKYYESFIDNYPNSKFIKEAEDIYQRSLEAIQKSTTSKNTLNTH